MSKDRLTDLIPIMMDITSKRTIIRYLAPPNANDPKTAKQFLKETGASKLVIGQTEETDPYLVWDAKWVNRYTDFRPGIPNCTYSRN